MARSMWRGAIQFGLVTIPIKLYVATESRGGLSFHLLHRDCGERINMKIHCPVHGEIARSDTVRGFEYSKGQYVFLDEADLDAVPLKTVRAIDIELFVEAKREAGDPIFVKQAYYIEPEAVGRKAFYLLKSVLAEENLSAICKIVLKDREVLASINPYANTMLLSTLYWPDEVRSLDELDLPPEAPAFKPAELSMARNLVTAMKADFHAEDYHDEYRAALMSVIESKLEGRPAEKLREVEKPTKIADLMSVLEQSVAAAREAKAGKATEQPARGAPRKPVAARAAAAARKPAASKTAGTSPSKRAAPTAKRAEPAAKRRKRAA